MARVSPGYSAVYPVAKSDSRHAPNPSTRRVLGDVITIGDLLRPVLWPVHIQLKCMTEVGIEADQSKLASPLSGQHDLDMGPGPRSWTTPMTNDA